MAETRWRKTCEWDPRRRSEPSQEDGNSLFVEIEHESNLLNNGFALSIKQRFQPYKAVVV